MWNLAIVVISLLQLTSQMLPRPASVLQLCALSSYPFTKPGQ